MATTAEKLQDYYPFSEDILERVDRVAEEQMGVSYKDFLHRNQLPRHYQFSPKHGKPIEVLDIRPRGGDYDGVVVYHEAMASTLDPNSVMHVMPLALTLPTKRIIAVGNPGRIGNGNGKIRLFDLPRVASDNLRPTVDPLLQYLDDQKVSDAAHVGFSYGAEKAQAAAEFANHYDQEVPYTIAMEPVALLDRGLKQLKNDFVEADERLDEYLGATESRAYLEARKQSGGRLSYSMGIALRASNWAISNALAHDGFADRTEQALLNQPEMATSIMWGTESELAIDGIMINLTDGLKGGFGDRVQTTRFEGEAHAMCDDIFFHTAMILHGMEQVAA